MMYFFLKKIKKFLVKVHLFNFLFFLFIFIQKIFRLFINKINLIFNKAVPILLYHRVDDVLKDPVMLVVQPKTFEEHIKYINKHYKPISLSELIRRLRNNSICGNEICVTFDDGYRDNLLKALPILEKYNTPATIFITTAHLGEMGCFSWDLEYSPEDRALFLSPEEIILLSKNRLIEIGAHTVNHPRLSSLLEDEQLSEINNSKEKLESIVGKKIIHFAYPFGSRRDYNKTSKKIIKDLDFFCGLENTDYFVTNFSDIYCLPRINIREGDTNYLAKKLFNK